MDNFGILNYLYLNKMKKYYLNQALRRIKDGASIKVMSLQAVYDCILLKKNFIDEEIQSITVKTLKNGNPLYSENQVFDVCLDDGGLIEFQAI